MLEKARRVVAPTSWTRAQALADAGAVSLVKRTPAEESWLVDVPPRAAPWEVTLWPGEQDIKWSGEREYKQHAAAEPSNAPAVTCQCCALFSYFGK